MSKVAVCRAVIVHPRFVHTLNDPPVAAAPPPKSGWSDLPLEVLAMVASHLDKAQDLLSLSSVCKDARWLASCPRLWRELCRRRFGVPAPEELGLAEDPSQLEPRFWVQLFRYNHCAFMGMLRGNDRPGSARLGAGLAQGPLVVHLQ